MKLLIDDNILLDVLMDRNPFVKDSALIWKICEAGLAEGVVSAHSIANLFYILRREMDPVRRKEVLSALQIIFRIEDTRGRDLIRAVELGWEDYEDAVRSVVAERIRADFLVTRNTKDYADSRVPVITPEEFLRYENIP